MHRQRIRHQLAFFIIVRIVLHSSFAMLLTLLPVFARGLNIDILQAGRAISVSQLANLVVPFLSMVTERYGYRYGKLLALGVFSLGTSLILISQSYAVFIATTFLATLGTFIFLPNQGAYFSDLVSFEQRGKVIAISESAWAASLMIGVPIIAFLIDSTGQWLVSYATLCILGAIFFVIILLSFKPTHPAREAGTSFFVGLKVVFKSPLAWAGMILSLILMPSVNLVGTVYGYWLEDTYGLNISALGFASVVLGAAFLTGTLASAAFTDKLGKIKSIFLGYLINILVASVIFFVNPTLLPALVWIFCFYVTAEFGFISGLTMLTELVPQYRTTFLAATTATSGLGGAFAAYIAPILYQNGFRANVLAVIVANLIVMALLFFMARKFNLAGKGW